MIPNIFASRLALLDNINPLIPVGEVTRVTGMVIEAKGIAVPIGSICKIKIDIDKYIEAEVVGFRDNITQFMSLGEMEGIYPGAKIIYKSRVQQVPVGKAIIGRVIDAFGNPIDDKGPIPFETYSPIYREPPDPVKRKRIDEPLSIGIRAIDSLITVGKGQRLGIFAGSGVGKSIMIGMITRNTSADINVIALVGERGREVREFIEKDLGEEGLKRSIVVVATSDKPPLVRRRCIFTACAIAEYFRDKGKDVLLIIDSLTRVALAQREIGLSIGEPPATRGYPPSVFSLLPKILERAGRSDKGSITGFYSVLVEGDDINEPISDTARSILDGHVYLSRDLANKGHYPAIECLGSISRVMVDIVSKEHMENAVKIRKILATYREAEDLINIGAYAEGTNPEIDYAKKMIGKVNRFLQQGIYEKSSLEEAVREMRSILKE